jgi:hypothetical protein
MTAIDRMTVSVASLGSVAGIGDEAKWVGIIGVPAAGTQMRILPLGFVEK